MNINLFTFANSNMSDFLNTLISSLVSIFLTAFVGWKIYLKQQRNNHIKENVTNFNLIFSYVILNLDYTLPMLDKTNQSIIELERFIKNLNKMKFLLDCKTGKETLNLKLILEADAKNSYIISNLDSIQSELVLKHSMIQFIGTMESQNYVENAVFLTKYGNTHFYKLFLHLNSYYSKVNELLAILNKTISNSSSGDYREQIVTICNGINTYEEDINTKIQNLSFILNYYMELKHCLEGIMFNSDLILNHLIIFNERYYSKYRNIFKTLDLDFSPIKIEKHYDIKQTDYYKENKDAYDKCSKVPTYRVFNINLFDKMQNRLNDRLEQLCK